MPDRTTTFAVGGDRPVRRIGLGAMRLPSEPIAERAASIALLRRAVELGVDFLDTAEMYGAGANELLLAEALHPYPEGVLVATKCGIDGSGADQWAVRGDPAFLREQVERSLTRLRVEQIGLMQLHRVDPEVPLADQLGALRDLQTEGKIRYVGLSEVTVAQLAAAARTVSVASVQNRYSLADRAYEDVVDHCTAHRIAFLPWRPVADVTGEAAQKVAADLGATRAQVALAWLLHRSPVVVPIPGTADPRHLADNVAAADLVLTPDQLDRLDATYAATSGGPPRS